jgi:F-type H+-transporting ATPase subunit alpha
MSEVVKTFNLPQEIGRVISVKDGVAFIGGLPSIRVGELIKFITVNEIYGMALNLESESVGCILFADDHEINQGTLAIGLNRLVDVPVGSELTGHIVNSLGHPIDGTNLSTSTRNFIERKAPGVITRESVSEPLLTGYKVIDALLPIGRGQRELIIGDRQTGKTTIGIDTILNQIINNRDEIEVFCVYVGIGQKKSSILNLKQILTDHGAFHYTIIVSSSASESASLQFLAPYCGAAMGEFFRDRGMHALIIYDDLTKHAIAYRQLSLLLRRPPGREAFPGDVFYAHARLLERACKLNENYGSGSLTALPIIETQAGDLSGYIPTNVISITDGQIYLEKDLFFKGIRPAVNVGSSVSRVGSKAQPYVLKIVSGSLRYELAQFREYSIFSQFDNDIDPITRKILLRGNTLVEALKQKPYSPMPLYLMTLIIFAASHGDTFLKFISRTTNINLLPRYTNELETFMNEPIIQEYFEPFFSMIHLIDKSDFTLYSNPLVFLLNFFNQEFRV